MSMAVVPGATLEVCTVQYWSQHNTSKVDIEVAFHGLDVDNKNLTVLGGDEFALVNVTATCEDEAVEPSVSVKNWCRELLPRTLRALFHFCTSWRKTIFYPN